LTFFNGDSCQGSVVGQGSLEGCLSTYRLGSIGSIKRDSTNRRLLSRSQDTLTISTADGYMDTAALMGYMNTTHEVYVDALKKVRAREFSLPEPSPGKKWLNVAIGSYIQVSQNETKGSILDKYGFDNAYIPMDLNFRNYDVDSRKVPYNSSSKVEYFTTDISRLDERSFDQVCDAANYCIAGVEAVVDGIAITAGQIRIFIQNIPTTRVWEFLRDNSYAQGLSTGGFFFILSKVTGALDGCSDNGEALDEKDATIEFLQEQLRIAQEQSARQLAALGACASQNGQFVDPASGSVRLTARSDENNDRQACVDAGCQ